MKMRLRKAAVILGLTGLLLAAPSVAGAADGATLFRSNCAGCHGRAGKGDGPGARSLNPKPPDLTQSRLSLPQIMKIVRDGRGACPSWRSSLSDGDIKNVSSHAKKLQK